MASSLDTAWSLHTSGRFSEAIDLCNVLLKSHPDHPAVLCCRAMSQWSLGEGFSSALADMQKAVDGAPKVAGLRHNLATVMASVGDLEGAKFQFLAALDINPNDTQAFYSLSQNMRYREGDTLIGDMQSRLDDGAIQGAAREFAHFGLAKAYDDIGDVAHAFAQAQEANALNQRPYDMSAERERLEKLRHLVAAGNFPEVEMSFAPVSPIFIVGMPRSGTTLVEAILSRHPAVFANGEQSLLPQVEAKFIQQFAGTQTSADEMLMELDPAQLEAEAGRITRHFERRIFEGNIYFTDKLPHNAERLGLAALLFPDAKFIHVKRHPLDSGVSNYFTRFHSGNGYSNDLEMIGEHFANVAQSVDLWDQIPNLDILRVRYEDLVADTQGETARILDYLDLEWDDHCLDPKKGQKGVITASQWQVRQPIYKRSVARWERYESHLAPMLKGLGGREFIDSYMG